MRHATVLILHAVLALTLLRQPPEPEQVQYAEFPPTKGSYFVLIVRHIDGDSIEIAHLTKQIVRIHGIDAPELSTEEGKKSAACLKDILPERTLVKARFFGKEKYGRVLGDFQGKEGFWASKTMIDTGMAKQWDGRGKK